MLSIQITISLETSHCKQRRYPKVTLTDNVRMQHRFATELFGIKKITLVYGWSMGGQQAYHWGAVFPIWSSESVSCAAQPARP